MLWGSLKIRKTGELDAPLNLAGTKAAITHLVYQAWDDKGSIRSESPSITRDQRRYAKERIAPIPVASAEPTINLY